MTIHRLALSLLVILLVAGCATDQRGQKETAGTLLGAVGGAIVGAQVGQGKGQLAGVAVGTLLGAYMGSEVGKSLDRADRLAMDEATQQAHAAPVGQTIAWNNPDSGHSGSVTPVRSGRGQSGEYCREYQTTVNIGGRAQSAYGVACQQSDGTWKIDN